MCPGYQNSVDGRPTSDFDWLDRASREAAACLLQLEKNILKRSSLRRTSPPGMQSWNWNLGWYGSRTTLLKLWLPLSNFRISKEPSLTLRINLTDLLMCSSLQAWPEQPGTRPRRKYPTVTRRGWISQNPGTYKKISPLIWTATVARIIDQWRMIL
jgi:hypothetical protein